MNLRVPRLVVGTTAAAAGVLALACGALLAVDAVSMARRVDAVASRADALRLAGQRDRNVAPTIHAELDDHTLATLARERRVAVLSWATLAAAAVCVAGAKWSLSAGRRHPAPPRFVALRIQAPLAAAVEQPQARDSSPGGRGVSTEATLAPALAADRHAVIDLAPLADIVARLGRDAAATIPIVQAIQREYRYVPDAALIRAASLTDIPLAQLAGVASFYPQFRRTPVGEHEILVCHGTACHVSGAPHVVRELRRELGIPPDQDTDPQRRFTVRTVACLGCCTIAPAVQVDGHTHGHVHPDGVADHVRELLRGAVETDRPRHAIWPVFASRARGEIRLGLGSCCVANGSQRVRDALHAALAITRAPAIVKPVGCVGMCHQTPFIEVANERGSTLYCQVRPEQTLEIVRRHFGARGVLPRLRTSWARTQARWRNDSRARALARPRRIERRDPHVAAFLDRQMHIATEHYGALEPLDLNAYLAHGGFDALRQCASSSAQDVIAQVVASGLRGRGGAGFPAGKKWAAVRAAQGTPKYVICNGDEGDPGAFMDRMLMESYPFRIIEGLAIAAYAVGAEEGVFYIRAEYPLAVERISEALRQCEARGLLRAGSRLVRMRVFHAAGAFVCGEETALIASLEGRRGTPTLRPPYPAQQGLWGRPTLVNNVETLAVVPWILRHGPDAFAAFGTDTSKGTKVFALAGKVRRGGLIEVPMGITLREIVEDIGGGIRDEVTAAGVRARRFKAVQIGGPSGGCVPARLADTPVDYERLAQLGAIMGSGGLVVLDDRDCMVELARYFLEFTQNQSCGKCVPCRIGTRRMREILDRLCAGDGRRDDLDKLEDLGRAVGQTSLCGLGKTAPNPVLTTLRYFREEYEAHLDGRCPAGRCTDLIDYRITEGCTGCTRCAQHCPVAAIAPRPYAQHEIDADRCTRCDVCRQQCPEDAIRIEPRRRPVNARAE